MIKTILKDPLAGSGPHAVELWVCQNLKFETGLVPPSWMSRQFSSGHIYEENVNLCWNFAKGTTAKAQGTTALAVGSVDKFKAWYK